MREHVIVYVKRCNHFQNLSSLAKNSIIYLNISTIITSNYTRHNNTNLL